MVGRPAAAAVAIAPSAAAVAATPLPPAVSPASAPPAAVAVPMASWTRRPTLDEVGVRGWLRRASTSSRSARTGAPRSATRVADGSTGSTLFLVVLLILGTMLLRTFRLAEPYQMHFDEVYHARTATEFLQAWRYGIVARHLRMDPPARRQVR